MLSPALSVLFALLIAVPLAGNLPGKQSRAGLREAEKGISAPLDPPIYFAKRGADPSRLQDEAAELARVVCGDSGRDRAGQPRPVAKNARRAVETDREAGQAFAL